MPLPAPGRKHVIVQKVRCLVAQRNHPTAPSRTLKRYVPTCVTVAVLLVAWQVWVVQGHVPSTLLASPTAMVQSMVRTWPTLWPATVVTFWEGFLGFAIAVALGVLLGIGLYCSKIAHAAFYPLLVAAQTLPLISVAPLFLIWFGFEPVGKVVIVALFAIFPVVVQTVRGLESVPQYYSDVALTCGATPSWTLWHVKLRVAAPAIFGGVRVSAAYVFATAATAEYLGARKGLGIWLQSAYNSFQTPLIFAATIMIVLMTVVLMVIIHVAERVILGNPADNADPDADQL
ncbi:ABC transporter permease [Bifidobacterium magnum]|uniref:ABC transporter permease n=1 Tax=Bifidobacterium magnum TaxID=1692 RepID=A0A087BDS6_9BIFI|nr:ABC transporter permease [Bifidobacterium magnum]